MRWGVASLLLASCTYTSPSSGGGGVPTDGPRDVMVEPDVLPDPALCTDTTTAECLGNVLRKCEEVGELPAQTSCAICATAPAPHCEVLVPTGGGATIDDLAPDGQLVDLMISDDTVADTDNGQIDNIRPSGDGLKNGIFFRRVNGIAIWRVHSLTLSGKLELHGGNAAVFAANRTIAINDEIRAQRCDAFDPGPGGGDGGIAETDGGGSGKGRRGSGQTDNASGGSGGGYGVAGSAGASSAAQGTTTAGVAYGDAQITTLRGGSGGGGGGGETFTAGIGGNGGGAVQLVANDSITFGANGGINAGGCGAKRNAAQNAGGGGGGSGGAILLEASAIDLTTGILAVNGGAGGGGDSSGQAGGNAKLSRSPAIGGGANGSSGGAGGNGGSPGSLGGGGGASGSSNQNAGGGGGAVGRIRINTRGDSNLTGDCAQCSPNFQDTGTTLTRGAATIN